MTDIQQLKAMWRLLFGDTEAFISLYFNEVVRKENTRVIEEDGRIVSALYMLPYPFYIWGKEITSSYISGAATLPEAQGRGLMQQLLVDSFKEMSRRNIPFSTLIPADPWLFGFYEKSGYATVFNYVQESYELKDIRDNYLAIRIHPFEKLDIKLCQKYLDQQLHTRKSCVLHPLDNFRTIVCDYSLSDGKIWVAFEEDDIPAGIIFTVYKGDDSFLAKEFIYANEKVKEALLQTAAVHYNVQKGIYRTPATSDKGTPLGMARIIDANEILSAWSASYPEKNLQINLTDPLLPENNGGYRVENGLCTKSDDFLTDPSCLVMNIAQLAQFLLLPEHPYMSLMFD